MNETPSEIIKTFLDFGTVGVYVGWLMGIIPHFIAICGAIWAAGRVYEMLTGEPLHILITRLRK